MVKDTCVEGSNPLFDLAGNSSGSEIVEVSHVTYSINDARKRAVNDQSEGDRVSVTTVSLLIALVFF